MLLLIDIGNTNITFCLYDFIKKKFFIKYKTNTFDYKNINHILYNIKQSYIIINNILISSVVLDINNFLLKSLKIFFDDCNVIFFEKKYINYFIKTLYDHNIGNDRIINCIAAIQKYKNKNLLIVDIGTMTTFDLITKKKIHLGGVIFPGLNLVVKSISIKSNLIKNIYNNSFIFKENIDYSCIQTTTENNLKNGILNGYIGVIKQIIENISLEFNEKFIVVGTGGNSYLFHNKKIFDIIDNELLFFGLLKIYETFVIQ